MIKDEVINIVKTVGINLNEIFINIELDNGITYNSIEFIEPDVIILHIFYENIDIESKWEDLNDYQRELVLTKIRPYLYN